MRSQFFLMRSQTLLNYHRKWTKNHIMSKKTFGEILEDLMAARKVSISILAKDLEASPKTVQEWVGKGGRVPRNLDLIKKLSEYFDVSVHYLLFGEEDSRNFINDILEKTEIHTGMYEVTIKKVRPKDRK